MGVYIQGPTAIAGNASNRELEIVPLHSTQSALSSGVELFENSCSATKHTHAYKPTLQTKHPFFGCAFHLPHLPKWRVQEENGSRYLVPGTVVTPVSGLSPTTQNPNNKPDEAKI